MKTCYGTQCYDYDGFEGVTPLPIKNILAIVAVISILFLGGILNAVSLNNSIANGDWYNDYSASEGINNDSVGSSDNWFNE